MNLPAITTEEKNFFDTQMLTDDHLGRRYALAVYWDGEACRYAGIAQRDNEKGLPVKLTGAGMKEEMREYADALLFTGDAGDQKHSAYIREIRLRDAEIASRQMGVHSTNQEGSRYTFGDGGEVALKGNVWQVVSLGDFGECKRFFDAWAECFGDRKSEAVMIPSETRSVNAYPA